MKQNKELIDIAKIEHLLDTLLQDRTTNRHIIWATNEYAKDYGFSSTSEIKKEDLAKIGIQPRCYKSTTSQKARTKDKAEVFTPSWLCSEMNNYCDDDWFGKENIFNVTKDKAWVNSKGKIKFPKNKNWKDYINLQKIEITCGEAPFICSRYDTTTGEPLDIDDRIGFLDRKLRVIGENVEDEKEWFSWVEQAYKKTYGYEYQGDSLILARMNLLLTFFEAMEAKFNHQPSAEQQKSIVDIITWNIWQMDGLDYSIPGLTQDKSTPLFGNFQKQTKNLLAKIKDWDSNNIIEFKSLTGTR